MRTILAWLCLMGLHGTVLSGVAWAAEAVPVGIAEVEKSQPHGWTLTGQVQRRYSIPLSFRVSGQVEDRQVEVGESVEKGQVLARLQSNDLKLSLAQSRATLESARANAENATRERKRLQNLYAKKLVSEQDLQRAQTAEVSAQKSVLAAESALALAQRQLEYSTLQAPQSGVLTAVTLEAGQVMDAGQPVMQLAAGEFEAEVSLPAGRLLSDHQVARASGVDQAFECEAQLRARSPFNQPQTLQYPAYYTLKNCSETPPVLGAVVRLSFAAKSRPELKRIPLTALFDSGLGSQVWVLENGRVQARPVEVERMDSGFAYITAGLPVGTEIVARGAHRLVDGQKVTRIGVSAP